MSSQQDEEVADPLEHKFLELKEQLVQVVKQLRKKPNDSLLCRRKEELTENMRAITELMIQENVVDSTSERNEGNGSVEENNDGDTNSIHVVGKEEQQEETDRCQDSQVQQVESREKQLRQKSVEISKQLEQLEHNDQNEVMRKNLEAELSHIAEELLQLEEEEAEKEEPVATSCNPNVSSCPILSSSSTPRHLSSSSSSQQMENRKTSQDELWNKYQHKPPQHSPSEIRSAVEQARNRLAKRGEKLGQLGRNTEEMQNQAKAFMEAAIQLNRREQRKSWFP